jgi:hypothetical protein
MKPSSKLIIAASAVAVLGAALLLALAAPQKTASWTDGDAIRAPSDRAPLREILWKPAEPLQGAGLGAADEYEPRYSADGTLVVFVRGRPGHNADLFESRWTPKGWATPTPIAAINTDKDELGPELSRDGASLYFYSDRPGGMGGYDLWVSRREGDAGGSWGTPTNLGPKINSRWNEYGPAFGPDGTRLYFSSNRPRPGEPVVNADSWSATVREHRTRHDYDLYSADLISASEAAPLEKLNTASDEGAPAISPAGDFLYFASDRAGGLGGFDIYRTRLSRAGAFGPIENLGPAINSGANDLDPALSAEGFRLTFSTDRPLPGSSPPTDAAAPPAAPATDPARYSLWTSTSREVYRDIESRPRDFSALSRIWPWLLLLLLTLIPLYALYRLLRDEAWRRRFRRLSLLAPLPHRPRRHRLGHVHPQGRLRHHRPRQERRRHTCHPRLRRPQRLPRRPDPRLYRRLTAPYPAAGRRHSRGPHRAHRDQPRHDPSGVTRCPGRAGKRPGRAAAGRTSSQPRRPGAAPLPRPHLRHTPGLRPIARGRGTPERAPGRAH